MSNVPCANIVVVPSANEPEQVEKKARAPSLPAKFGKFIQFAYYLIQQNNAAQDFAASVDDEPASLEHIFKLYASIDDQQAFVQAFLDQSKEINQKIRQEILQRKRADAKAAKAEARALAKAATRDAKPPKEPKAPKESKAPKEKQPRQKKEKVSATTGEVSEAASSSESESETKEKKVRGRKPKAKVLSSQDAFVNEMVQLANGDEPAPAQATPTVETATPAAVESATPTVETAKPEKKAKKESKAPKAEKESKPPKAEKESNPPKASKKTKAEKVSEQAESNETAVSVLNLNGQNYLLDDNLAVYHFQTHHLLGQFNPTTQIISFS